MKLTEPQFISSLNVPYRKDGGRLYFIDGETQKAFDKKAAADVNAFKRAVKQYPALYEFLWKVISPGVSCIRRLLPAKALRQLFTEKELTEKLIVNIGSGIKVVHPEVINLDIYPLPHVELVADVARLPFRDECVDMVICESVLEHIAKPERVVSEITRVLKKGGYIYVSVPFVYPFHASPNDYFRWSKNGIRESFNGFDEIQSGMRAGPMAALQGVLMHLFAIPLSLGSEKLYIFWNNLFMVVFAPLKILDFLFSAFPHASDIAADVYFLGRKK